MDITATAVFTFFVRAATGIRSSSRSFLAQAKCELVRLSSQQRAIPAPVEEHLNKPVGAISTPYKHSFR